VLKALRITMILAVAASICGCGKSRSESAAKGDGNDRTWGELGGDDVIVSVNGVALTKSEMASRQRLREAVLAYKMPTASRDYVRNSLKGRLPSIAKAHLPRSIYLGEAKRRGITAEEEDIKEAKASFMRQFGVENRPSFEKFNKSLDELDQKTLADEIAGNATINALFRKAYPKEYAVSNSIIAEVAEDIDRRNRIAGKAYTNALETAAKAIERIKAGEDFGDVADQMSAVPRDQDMLWGEVYPEDLEKMLPDIFVALAGKDVDTVTDALELDDAIHIVKLIDRVGSGRRSMMNSNPEKWVLGEIVIRLPQYFRISPDGDVIAHQRNEQLKSVRRSLYEKCIATARVEYPNGTNLWERASSKSARGIGGSLPWGRSNLKTGKAGNPAKGVGK